jgi:hypothetical protein
MRLSDRTKSIVVVVLLGIVSAIILAIAGSYNTSESVRTYVGEEPDPTPDLGQQLAQLEAEQARLEAQEARLEAQEAHLDAWEAGLEAQEARLEAQEARLEAEQARLLQEHHLVIIRRRASYGVLATATIALGAVVALLRRTRARDALLSQAQAALQNTVSALGEQVQTYAVARLEGLGREQPLELGTEYTLHAGILKTLPEGFESVPIHLVLDSKKPIIFEISVQAEDMDIGPTWAQEFTYIPDEDAELLEFQLIPRLTGHKDIRVEFYHQRHWLTQIKFEVEVVEARELVLA